MGVSLLFGPMKSLGVETHLAADQGVVRVVDSTVVGASDEHVVERYLVISPTSDFANVTFANVLGRFAKAKSRFANVLLVTSPMY